MQKDSKGAVETKATKEKAVENKAPKARKAATVTPAREYHKASCGYLLAGAQAGSMLAAGVAAGAYISNFNLEAFFGYGLSKSDDIYWTDESTVAYGAFTYKPLTYGLRVGYGFNLAQDRLLLTPQAGVGVVSVSASAGGKNQSAYALSATVSLRADYALTSHMGLFLQPEMNFAVSKSDTYSLLEEQSSDIKAWATGFNARVGISITF